MITATDTDADTDTDTDTDTDDWPDAVPTQQQYFGICARSI